MKYVFGINVTKNKYNNVMDGYVFHSGSASVQLREAFEHCSMITEEKKGKEFRMEMLEFVEYISFSIACLLLLEIYNAIGDYSWAEIFADKLVCFCGSVILLIFALIIKLVRKNKKRNYENSDEYRNKMNYIYNVIEYAKCEFTIPPSARIIEVLFFKYKVKKNKVKVLEWTEFYEKGVANFDNHQFYCYVEKENLYLTDFYDEWVIPLNCFTDIKKIKKSVYIPCWKKKEPDEKEIYKKYAKETNEPEQLAFKFCYAFCITWKNENFELLIPPYELKEMSALVGIDYYESYDSHTYKL